MFKSLRFLTLLAVLLSFAEFTMAMSSDEKKKRNKGSDKPYTVWEGTVTFKGDDGLYYRQDVSKCEYGCAVEQDSGDFFVCGTEDDCAEGLPAWAWILILFGIRIVCGLIFFVVKKVCK